MTFESIANANANDNATPGADANAFGVKISYGNDIRRASCSATTFSALSELVAKLFSLDQASLVLKYQDDDGDKITMSSNEELQEALRVNKDKTIRLFVESNKPVVPPVNPNANPEVGADAGAGDLPNHPFFGWRGGFGGRGRGGMGGMMWRGGPFRHSYHFGPHGHGPHGPGPYGPGPHHGPHGHGPHHDSHHGPHRGHGPHGPHHGPHGHGPHGPHHGPAEEMTGDQLEKMSEHQRKMAKHMWKKEFHAEFNERKSNIKRTIKEMKANAKTPEEFAQIKALKEQFKAELKQEKQLYKGFVGCNKDDKEKRCHQNRESLENRANRWGWGEDNTPFRARHIADVTIPDNSELPANTPVTKTWRLKNVGTAAWPAGTQLLAVGRHGDHLNGPEKVPVASVEPGQEGEVSVPFLTPSEAGRYVAYYRLATAEGIKFGQRVWVSFLIPPATVPMA